MLCCTPVLYLTDRNLGQPYIYKPLGKPTSSSLWFYFKREKKVFSDYKSQVAILLSAQRAETILQSSVTKGRNITKYVHIAHINSRSHQNKSSFSLHLEAFHLLSLRSSLPQMSAAQVTISFPSRLTSRWSQLGIHLPRQTPGITTHQAFPGQVSGTTDSAKLPSWEKEKSETRSVTLCLLIERCSPVVQSHLETEKNIHFI